MACANVVLLLTGVEFRVIGFFFSFEMFEAAGLKDRVYLDYNATTPLEPQVVASITHGLNNAWANPSSSSHLGAQVKQLINNARSQVGQMIEAPSSDILFTSGGTEVSISHDS